MGTQEDIKNKQLACFSQSHFQVKSRRVAGWGTSWEGGRGMAGREGWTDFCTDRQNGQVD